jgi:putative addiction module killer protein
MALAGAVGDGSTGSVRSGGDDTWRKRERTVPAVSDQPSQWLQVACAQARIRVRLNHLALGNFGDCEPVSEGVLELRVHVGPGYRVYCARHGKAVVVLLTGGDKSSQPADIRRAKEMWADWKRRQR